MNDDVRFPIETTFNGNEITKTCVEDVYKIVNRIQDAMDKAHNKSIDVIDTLSHEEYGENTSVVFGRGVSRPCLTDAFDEEIGNNIAFMKMKLNANIKKRNFLVKIYNNYVKLLNQINSEIYKVEDLIELDLCGIRRHNSEYLNNNYINEELKKSSIEREIFRNNKLQEKFDKIYEI